MPKYRCPSCGREVVMPEGRYYCKHCGADLVLVGNEEGVSEIEEVKKEQFGEILKELNNVVLDLTTFYNKNQDLEFVRRLSLEFRDFIKAKNALFDKAAKLGVPVA